MKYLKTKGVFAGAVISLSVALFSPAFGMEWFEKNEDYQNMERFEDIQNRVLQGAQEPHIERDIWTAIEKFDEKRVKEIVLSPDFDSEVVDRQGDTPVFFAYKTELKRSNNRNITKMLIERSTEKALCTPTEEFISKSNKVFLLYKACLNSNRGCDLEIVELLLRSGKCLRLIDTIDEIDRMAPIHWACLKLIAGTDAEGRLLEVIIKAGADLNLKNSFGKTPSKLLLNISEKHPVKALFLMCKNFAGNLSSTQKGFADAKVFLQL